MSILWDIIFSDTGKMILTAIGAILGYFGVTKLSERKGRMKERADAALRDAKANAKNERDRNEIDRDASGADARDRLRADWTRD